VKLQPDRTAFEADSPFRVRFRLPSGTKMSVDEFFEICQQNDGLWFEKTAEGDLIVSSPRGGLTGAQSVSIGAQVYTWANGKGGMAVGYSTGFVLPNGAIRSPTAAWISPQQLATITSEQMERFLHFCPWFLVELLSPTDRLSFAQDKMEEYNTNGCRLGWLIDPSTTQAHIYRPGQPTQILAHPKTLIGDPEMPGFVLDLEPVWER
jgi:Uma2 family endonuclease